jgi:hypothetical protein
VGGKLWRIVRATVLLPSAPANADPIRADRGAVPESDGNGGRKIVAHALCVPRRHSG